MLLAVWLFIVFLLPVLGVLTAETEFSARGLDSILQNYAYRAFEKKPKTGAVYDGNVPANLTGIKVAALRLRSGSMRRRGVSSYKEFHIPIGVIEQPYVERLVLVYHNLGNWSELYYPLPGFTYLAPVLGLLAYNGSDLSALDLPDLDIRASKEPMRVNLSLLQRVPEGASPRCVYFGLRGSVEFDNVIDKNVCLVTKQGHFSIVVELNATAPVPAPTTAPERGGGGGGGGGGEKGSKKAGIIVGSVLGGFLMLGLLGLSVFCLQRCRNRKKIKKMEAAADRGVPLMMTTVGNTKAPVATEIRTRPMLEDDYLI